MKLLLLLALSLAAGDEAEPAAPAERADMAAPRYAEDPRAYEVGLLLRCPVCQGMPIADSPADMAQSMMARIREMSAEGQSKEEIIAYFTERYGDWVLLEPRKEGLNWLVWVMPPLFLLLGILVALGYGRGSRSQSETNTKASSHGSSEQPSEDPYLQALREEVDG